MRRVSRPTDPAEPLFGAAASRQIESRAAAGLPPHTLMQRAGLAVARLALAIAPYAKQIWVAAGPGNNGGDGFEAAMHLQRHGRAVHVTLCGDAARRPADAAASLRRAQDAGVAISPELPSQPPALAIDALLGLGATRAPEGNLAQAIAALNAWPAPRLAVDLPSGLDADSGRVLGDTCVRADHTLVLLTLKPGLFTAAGRDACGTIWFDDLGVTVDEPPTARLLGADAMQAWRSPRAHRQHKGSFGDVLAIGGAPGMAGALNLAARAALAAGAGRVYAIGLDPNAPQRDDAFPELMWRRATELDALMQGPVTAVVGCGGGALIGAELPRLLSRAERIVLDADALNAIAADTSLAALLHARHDRGHASVLTPHPLEAARLLGLAGAAEVQADRLAHAQRLADRLRCVVLLKGSGTIIAAPGSTPALNPSGNARLASAGSGDVLAGWLAGLWSSAAAVQQPGLSATHGAVRAACAAAWSHGVAAGEDTGQGPLPASRLLHRLSERRSQAACPID